MKFIELFAGIGGFRLGLEQAGHECVFANEWLARPRSIYKYNFGEEPNGQDVRTLDPFSIPDADLIVGGFPCATFSVAGKRTGLSDVDTRGTLFFEIIRIAGAKRTPYLFLENVKGLLNHDDGRTFAVILLSLDELGYDVQWEVLNSKNFGVPQHRERVFIVANLRTHPRPKVFPIGKPSGFDNKGEQFHKKQQSRTLQARLKKGIGNTESRIVSSIIKSNGERFDNLDEICDIVRPCLTPDRIAKRQRGRRFKEEGEPAFTLGAQDRHGILFNGQIRRLTPLECERLQGLPDFWTKYYADGKLVLDNERYERCGRTVTIPVIKAIGERLHNFY